MTSPSSSEPPPLPQAAVPGLVQDLFATLLGHKGLTTEAIQQRLAALQKLEEVLGTDHPELQPSLEQLAMDFLRKDDFTAAADVLEKTYAYRVAHLGSAHPEAMDHLALLTECLMKAERFTSARSLLEQQLTLFDRVLGPDHEQSLNTAHLLAQAYIRLGDGSLAEGLLRRTQEGFERTLGDDHPKTTASLYSLFEYVSDSPDSASAEQIGEKLFTASLHSYGYSHPLTISAASLVVGLYIRRQNFSAAVVLLRRALAAFPPNQIPMSLPQARVQKLLAAALDMNGKSNEAEVLARSALQTFKNHLGPKNNETRSASRYVADLSFRRFATTRLGRFCLWCGHIIGRRFSLKREA